MAITKQAWPEDMVEMIPESWYRTDYISREVSPTVFEFDVFEMSHNDGFSVIIDGPTGCGKTSAVYAYAAERGLPLYSVSCNGAAEASTLFGTYVPDEDDPDARYTWMDGPVTKLARHGGVLLLNEINFLPPKVAATLFSLMDKRRTLYLTDHDEIIVANPRLFICSDYNPDYEGVRRLNEALKNRYAHKLSFDYDPVIEAQLVSSPTLLRIANNIRVQHKEGNVETPVATNMLQEFEKIGSALTFDYAIDNFVNAFHADEKAAVRQVFDHNRTDLESDYGVEYDES